jgi:hypothetical protein
MNKKQYGVHESHCCPKHGCKYGDEDCPVVNRKTDKYNLGCESCQEEYEHPTRDALLLAWIRSHTEYALMGSRCEYESGFYDTEVIRVSDIETISYEIENDMQTVRTRGIKGGWWTR